MGFWVNIYPDAVRPHTEDCRYSKPVEKQSGGWEYADTPADALRLRDPRKKWLPCKDCSPNLIDTSQEGFVSSESQRPMVLMFYTASLSPADVNWPVQLHITCHAEGTIDEIVESDTTELTLLLTEEQAWGLGRILQVAFKDAPY